MPTCVWVLVGGVLGLNVGLVVWGFYAQWQYGRALKRLRGRAARPGVDARELEWMWPR